VNICEKVVERRIKAYLSALNLIKQFIQEPPNIDNQQLPARCEKMNRVWFGKGELTAIARKAFRDYAHAIQRAGILIESPMKPQ
jgi:hypothetical protein